MQEYRNVHSYLTTYVLFVFIDYMKLTVSTNRTITTDGTTNNSTVCVNTSSTAAIITTTTTSMVTTPPGNTAIPVETTGIINL